MSTARRPWRTDWRVLNEHRRDLSIQLELETPPIGRNESDAMLKICCPWCGERDEVEFRYGGEAHVAYPEDPRALDDRAWGDYLFVRNNPKGWFRERWVHSAGCRRWFNAVRHTLTHRIALTYRIGELPELPPTIDAAASAPRKS